MIKRRCSDGEPIIRIDGYEANPDLIPLIPDDLKKDLMYFYKQNSNLTDRDLYIQIERHFGNRLLLDVCIPNEMHTGECVVAAIYLLRTKGKKTLAEAMSLN